MNHCCNPLASLTLAACVATAVQGGPDPGSADPRQRLRLVVAGGGHYEVPAPLSEKDGLLVFRLDNGRLVSIQRDQVLEILPVERVRAKPVTQAQTPATGTATDNPRFTNSDLRFAPPDLPRSDVPIPDRPPLPVPSYADTQEVANDDQRARLEARALGLLDQLEVLRTRERVWLAFLECERADIPIRECRPEINRVNRGINRIYFRTPTQRSLEKQIHELRLLQQEILSELAELGVDPLPEEGPSLTDIED